MKTKTISRTEFAELSNDAADALAPVSGRLHGERGCVMHADPDKLYDDCCEAVAVGNADDACDAASKLREWAFSDDAKQYAKGTITQLIAYCDLVILNNGHKCRPLGETRGVA